ncbi:SLCO4A [Acanthosepion pharaonis]|uniref:SLCO4A n=1 Tax=Acanthosepion pharaonis TaxID=158019 RepID=A0A812EIZ4_ACAPH|nr:SLCO4A [Sepia pharaonis]
MFLFPVAKKIRETRENEAHQGHKPVELQDPHQGATLKELPSMCFSLLRNPSFIFVSLASANEGILLSGISTFLPKFIENQFSQTASWASMLAGFVGISGAAGGQFLGGYLCKKLGLNVSGKCRLSIVTLCLGLFMSAAFWAKCDKVKFAGISVPYSESSMALTGTTSSLPLADNPVDATCNNLCHCNEEYFNPVCGSDGIQYFSSCHAGCMTYNKTGKRLRFFTKNRKEKMHKALLVLRTNIVTRQYHPFSPLFSRRLLSPFSHAAFSPLFSAAFSLPFLTPPSLPFSLCLSLPHSLSSLLSLSLLSSLSPSPLSLSPSLLSLSLLSLSLSPFSHSLSLPSLTLSLSLLSLSLSPYSHSLSLLLSLSLSPSLSLSVSSFSHSLSPSRFFLSLSSRLVSFSLSLFPSRFFLSLSLFPSRFFSLSLSLSSVSFLFSSFLSLSLSSRLFSFSLSLSLFPSRFFSLSLSLSSRLVSFLSLSLRLFPSSFPSRFFLSLSLSLFPSRFFSLSPSLSVFSLYLYSFPANVYHNCACISPLNKTAKHEATEGVCPKKTCIYLHIALFILFFFIITTFLAQTPIIAIILRCVPDNHRTFGVGLANFISRIFGTLPGPLLFGFAIDKSCMVWKKSSCAEELSCWIYKDRTLSRNFFILVVVVRTFSILFMVLANYLYKPPTQKVQTVIDESQAYINPVAAEGV